MPDTPPKCSYCDDELTVDCNCYYGVRRSWEYGDVPCTDCGGNGKIECPKCKENKLNQTD